MLRFLKWAGLGLVVLVALLGLGGIAFEQWSRASVGTSDLAPGELVEVQGRLAHLHCAGTGSPTVILEAGFGPDGSTSWAPIFDEASTVTRVCAYDRAGILFSEAGPKPRSARLIADELHALLQEAGEAAPYVMVGHSLGGPLVRVYTARYPDEVLGVVFVDASHPEQFQRWPPELLEAVESMLPSPLAMRAMASTGVLRFMMARQSGGDPQVVDLRLPQSVPGMLAELDALEAMFLEANEVSGFGSRPLIVLAAGRSQEPRPPGITDELAQQERDLWRVLQREQAALSSEAELRVIEDAAHYIHHDRPDVVVDAIADVVGAVRAR